MALGGLDIGSTGAKITVLDEAGSILHTGYRNYPVMRGSSAHELHADDIWETVRQLLHEAATLVPDITALGVTSFGESFVLLDEAGVVLLPTMLYTDPRGGDEAEELRQKLGDERIYSIAGCTPHAMYSLPKLMWIKKHRPDVHAKAKHVCLIGDFLVYRLTGQRFIDHSLAARTMAFDVQRLCWSGEIFDAAGVDPSLFSIPVPTGTNAGCVLPSVARELGLREKIHVVICCHDQVAAAIGSNVLRCGSATYGAGTVACITPVFSSFPNGRALMDGNYSIIPFLYENTYCLYAYTYTGGALVNWFVDTFAGDMKSVAKDKDISVYSLMESGMRDDPTGILVLPHFAGAATPYMDTGSKGAILGLDLAHTQSDVYRAVLEGVMYEMAINIERLRTGGITVEQLNATGGGAKSGLWLQMMADILNIPVTRMQVDEAGTLGGILLTGVATGTFDSLKEAINTMVKPLQTFSPRVEMHKKYSEIYSRYRNLYHTVRPLV